jgi:hypothetical protein
MLRVSVMVFLLVLMFGIYIGSRMREAKPFADSRLRVTVWFAMLENHVIWAGRCRFKLGGTPAFP